MDKQSKGHHGPHIGLCAFVLPMLLLMVAFAIVGIFPFGERVLLIADMGSEYIDYLAQMNQTLRSQGSLLRSWNMGMGLNMLGLIAFYTSSPLNILVLLLPLKWITEAVFLVMLLKIGLGGFFFSLYARYTFPETSPPLTVAFSVAYSLMAYNIAYSSNIMWLDGTALLPLVILGVEKLIREKKVGILLVSLVASFFTSYYIGYMIGVFSFLYLSAMHLVENATFKTYIQRIGKLIGLAILAGACCAFLLLPAFLNLKNGQMSMWDVPVELLPRIPAIQLFTKLVPGSYDTLTDTGLPNLYSSMLGLLLCVSFFFIRGISSREKWVLGGFVGLLLISFSVPFFDLAWHAFEDPTWFPARYSFVFSFLILHIGLRSVSALFDGQSRPVATSAIILVLLFFEIAMHRYGFTTWENVLLGLAFLAVYAIWLTRFKSHRHQAAVACLLFVCLEMGVNAHFLVKGLDEQFYYPEREGYTSYHSTFAPAVASTRALDSGVYRTEILHQRSANGGLALDYYGISHYSTTTDQALNSFLRQLSYNKGTVNELRFARTTPLTNGLMGIRYILAKDDLGPGYTLQAQVADVGIYQNEAAFPLAFFAPQKAMLFTGESNNTFALQNEMVQAVTQSSSAVFAPILPAEEIYTNVDRMDTPAYLEYARRASSEPAVVEFLLENPTGEPAYAYIPVYGNRFTRCNAYVDDVFVQKELGYRNNSIIPLGSEQQVRLRLEIEGNRIRVQNPSFAVLHVSEAVQAATQARANQMVFTRFEDTVVEGRIFAPEAGVLVTTFPIDSGWKIRLNGEPVSQQAFAGVFLSIPLPAGEHVLTMKYWPPGFPVGMGISFVALASIAIWWGYKRYKNKSL